MADTYGVVPEDVRTELRGLFPIPFDTTTVPTLAQVTSWISTADSIAVLHLVDSAGQTPALSDAAASIVKTFIREWVKSQVIRVVYAGQDPVAIGQASKPYVDTANAILKELDEMGSQAVGTGMESARVAVAFTIPPRDLLVEDGELGDSDTYARERKY
jgi:hypothetical protein